VAMTAGMIPMAIGFGQGGDQTAPLGVAVIGGLLFSTFAVLLVLPLVYNRIAGNKKYEHVSLDPDDENSKNFGNQ